MSNKGRIASLLLVLVMTMGVVIPVHASSVEDAKDKAEEIASEVNEAASEKEVLAAKLNQLTSEMQETENRLEEKQAEIDEAEQELILAKMEENDQHESMKLRIKYMYENGSQNWIEVLLGSENMSDFLNRAEYIMMISEYDRNKLDDYQLAVRKVEDQEAVLESEYEEIYELQEQLSEQRAETSQLLEEKSAELAGLEQELAAAEEAVKEAEEAERKRIEAEKARQEEERKRKEAEEAAKAEEEAKAEAEAEQQSSEESEAEEDTQEQQETVVSGNGYFTHPCPGMSYQSSYFGEVRYSIGDLTPHKGHDYAAAEGTPIYAAASGSVLIAGYSYSAGYWVVINHGDGLVTKYMHMYQQPAVSAGQYVERGQYIGGVGTTGQSTGNHLHFQVEEYGVPVNPDKYL